MAIQTALDSISNSSGSPFGFKNRIINGATVIDQRNAGASYAQSTTAIYGLDRWKTDIDTGSGRWNVQRVADAPSGFNYSLKVTITTQEAQPSNAALHQVYQITEGFNTADFAYGTVNATPVTISFWVKSSIVGIQSVNLHSGDYCYTTSYVINVANTWEYKQVTIPGPTAGTWSTDTGSGILVVFNIGGGTSQIRTANTWSSQITTGIVSGSVYLPATNGATWQITGVQLEKGSTASAFDYRPYGTELALCQRYFEKSQPQGSAVAGGTAEYFFVGSNFRGSSLLMRYPLKWAVTKRATPTVTFYNPRSGGTASQITTASADYSGTTSANLLDSGMEVQGTTNSGGASGDPAYVNWTASAEL